MFKVVAGLTIFLSMIMPAAGGGDVCQKAGEMVNMTKAQANEYFEWNLRGYIYSGTGTVRDVSMDARSPVMNSSILCGNHDIIYLECSSGGESKLNVGDQIKFSGRVVRIKKTRDRINNNCLVLLYMDEGGSM